MKQVAAPAGPGDLGAVRRVDPKDFRHLCDRCAGSIDDVHRTCACGADLCLHCCRGAAGDGGEVLPSLPPTNACPSLRLTPSLSTHRLLSWLAACSC